MHRLSKLFSGVAAVLLNIDGTLVNSNEAQARAWVDVFGEYCRHLDITLIRALLGHDARTLIARAVGPVSDDLAHRLDQRRWQLLKERYLHMVFPMEKSNELLVLWKSRGIRVLLVSQASPEEQRLLLSRGDVDGQFPNIRTLTGPPSRCKAELLLRTLGNHPLDPGQCLFVASSANDGRAAHQAGIRFLAVEDPRGPNLNLPSRVMAPSLGAIYRLLLHESLPATGSRQAQAI